MHRLYRLQRSRLKGACFPYKQLNIYLLNVSQTVTHLNLRIAYLEINPPPRFAEANATAGIGS